MAEYEPKGKLGSGSRFAAVEAAAKKSGASDPGAVAYAAGVKAHGAAEMHKLAEAGRARHMAAAKGRK